MALLEADRAARGMGRYEYLRIQRLLADKAGELAPKSLNDLRAFVFNFFQVARKPGGPWGGRANPVEDVERFKVSPAR